MEKVSERHRDVAHLWADKRIPRFFRKVFEKKWNRRFRDVYFALCEIDSDFSERRFSSNSQLRNLTQTCTAYSGLDQVTVTKIMRMLRWLGLIEYQRKKDKSGWVIGSDLFLCRWIDEETHMQSFKDCLGPEDNSIDVYVLIRSFPYKGITLGIKNPIRIGEGDKNPIRIGDPFLKKEKYKDFTKQQEKSNDIKYNDIKSNDIKSNDIKSNDIKSNDIKSNDIKSNDSNKGNACCLGKQQGEGPPGGGPLSKRLDLQKGSAPMKEDLSPRESLRKNGLPSHRKERSPIRVSPIVQQIVDHWNGLGLVHHKPSTNVFAQSAKAIRHLLSGEFVCSKLPELNSKVFTPEEICQSMYEFSLAALDESYSPTGSLKKTYRGTSLCNFFYNPRWEGEIASLFLRYLKAPAELSYKGVPLIEDKFPDISARFLAFCDKRKKKEEELSNKDINCCRLGAERLVKFFMRYCFIKGWSSPDELVDSVFHAIRQDEKETGHVFTPAWLCTSYTWELRVPRAFDIKVVRTPKDRQGKPKDQLDYMLGYGTEEAEEYD
jgi:hypothetical protein